MIIDNNPVRRDSVTSYGLSDDAWQGFTQTVMQMILDRGCHTVCEIGGGANPALPRDFVERNRLEYVIIDISAEELDKAPKEYRTRVMDVTQPILSEEGVYDFVFSKMLAKHVKDGATFHRNIHQLLRKNGLAFHFFPTLYAPPYVLNLLLPERLTYRMLNLIQSGREKSGRLGKFPAYYRWCRGPTRRQIGRFESLGYRVLRYTGFFGHPGYYARMPLLERTHRALASWLLRHPQPWLTSFAYVVLEKKA